MPTTQMIEGIFLFVMILNSRGRPETNFRCKRVSQLWQILYLPTLFNSIIYRYRIIIIDISHRPIMAGSRRQGIVA